MKIIYHYNIYGYYCGQGFADESPLEPGVYLIPAMATDIEPPVPEDNQLIRWIDDHWTLEGMPDPEPEPEGPTQDELKKQALDLLNAEYAEKLAIIARDYDKPSLLFSPGDPQITINQAAIAAEYKNIAAELITKQGVILNG